MQALSISHINLTSVVLTSVSHLPTSNWLHDLHELKFHTLTLECTRKICWSNESFLLVVPIMASWDRVKMEDNLGRAHRKLSSGNFEAKLSLKIAWTKKGVSIRPYK